MQLERNEVLTGLLVIGTDTIYNVIYTNFYPT